MAYVVIASTRTDADSPLDQSLFDDIRNNFDDHELRLSILQVIASDIISTHFMQSTLDTDVWDQGFGAGSQLDMLISTGDHVAEIDVVANQFGIIAATTKRAHFRLNQDMGLAMEWRAKEFLGGAAPDNVFFGVQDASLALVNASIADVSDCIGFIKGSTAGQYKFRTAKAGTATESDNVGTRAVWHKLRLDILKSGGTLTVAASIDDVAIGGSPFSTNIPDTVVLRPFFGIDVAGDAMVERIDYVDFRWSSITAIA